MLDAIGVLRSITGCWHAGTAPPEHAMVLFCDAVEKFLSRQCQSLDEALGLSGMRGGVPWWKEEAIRRRDAALRALGVLICPNGSAQEKARAVRMMTHRYAASSWRFDREHEVMPEHYAGRPLGLVWEAFKTGATMPLCERHLRNILG